VGVLRDAGYQVIEQEFALEIFAVGDPPQPERTGPTEEPYAHEQDFWLPTYSAPGDATGPVRFVDTTTCNGNVCRTPAVGTARSPVPSAARR
jgi:hypothetical protein